MASHAEGQENPGHTSTELNTVQYFNYFLTMGYSLWTPFLNSTYGSLKKERRIRNVEANTANFS